jgi:hypothetical protein
MTLSTHLHRDLGAVAARTAGLSRPRSLLVLAAIQLAAACNGQLYDERGEAEPEPERPAGAVALRISPPRAAYWTGQRIELALVDAETGAALEDSAWIVRPEAAATLEGEGLTLVEEGRLEIEGCAGARCARASLEVDDGSPRVALAGPLHGAEVDEGLVVVEGSAMDARALSLWVNGEPAVLDAMGRFRTEVPVRLGVETLEVVASDGRSPTSRVSVDVLAAPRFEGGVAASGEPAAWLAESLVVRATEDALDDGEDSPLAAPEDLADLIRSVLVRADPSGLVSSRFESEGVDLRISRLALRDPEVHLALRARGLEAFLRTTLTLTTLGRADLGGPVAPLDGEISVTAAASVTLRADADGLEVERVSFRLESLEARMRDSRIGPILEQTGTSLRATLERVVEDVIGRAVDTEVEPVLDGAWATLGAGIGSRVDVALPGGAVPLELRASPLVPEIAAGGALTLPVSLRVGGRGLPTKTTRGLARQARPRAEGLPPGGALSAYVSLDALNGALHVLWNMGALDVSLDEAVSEGSGGLVDGARLALGMAPLVRAPRAGEAGTLVLEVGAASLEVAEDALRGRFGVRARLALTASIDGEGRLQLALAEETHHIETLERPRGLLVTETVLEGLVRSEVVPMLETALAGVTVALVGGVERSVPLVASGEPIEAALVARGLRISHGWIVVDGAWRFRLP